jgi:hypothetical protein
LISLIFCQRIDHSLHRRHLTKSQWAAIGTLALPLYQEEARARKELALANKPRNESGKCRKLFAARPMPELISPVWALQFAATGKRPAFLRDVPFVIFPKS